MARHLSKSMSIPERMMPFVAQSAWLDPVHSTTKGEEASSPSRTARGEWAVDVPFRV